MNMNSGLIKSIALLTAGLGLVNLKLLKYLGDGHIELYNIAEDLSETHNRAKEDKEKAEYLLKKLQSWKIETGARGVILNPEYER